MGLLLHNDTDKDVVDQHVALLQRNVRVGACWAERSPNICT